MIYLIWPFRRNLRSVLLWWKRACSLRVFGKRDAFTASQFASVQYHAIYVAMRIYRDTFAVDVFCLCPGSQKYFLAIAALDAGVSAYGHSFGSYWPSTSPFLPISTVAACVPSSVRSCRRFGALVLTRFLDSGLVRFMRVHSDL